MRSSLTPISLTGFSVLIFWGANFKSLQAQPITAANDGTGTQVTEDGGRFDITEGTHAGANQFHSFEDFGLETHQTANFVSTPDVQNVMGRVTGGNPSEIDGTITVTNSDADLYLMNPSGVIFGENAQLDVPGSFTATSATGIGLEGGGAFKATGDNDYNTLVGAPNSFEFAEGEEAGTIVNRGDLAVKPGKTLSLVGGSVTNEGSLNAPEGRVSVVAVPEGESVKIVQPGMVLELEVDSSTMPDVEGDAPVQAEIKPTDVPKWLTGGELDHASQMVVTADGTVRLTGSQGLIQNEGTIAAQDIQTQARSLINRGEINASATSGGTIEATQDYLVNSGTIQADGLLGNGGLILLNTTQRILQTADGLISARGRTQLSSPVMSPPVMPSSIQGEHPISPSFQVKGGEVILNAGASGTQLLSGRVDVSSQAQGTGGRVEVLGDRVGLFTTEIDASGHDGGGEVLVGGDYQGQGDVPRSQEVIVSSTTLISANAFNHGDGGRVILWSDDRMGFAGRISAQAGRLSGDGGFVEVSGLGGGTFAGLVDTSAPMGKAGTLLIDPKNITIANGGTAGSQFSLAQTFLNPNGGGEFGIAVALDGTNILIGDTADGTAAAVAGAAYLFDTSGTLLQSYFNPTPAGGDQFGGSLALQGTNVVIGAAGNTGASNSGVVYLYSTSGGLLQTLNNPNPGSGNRFGESVALDGTNLLIGDPFSDIMATNAGAAYRFNTSGTLQQTIVNPGSAANDQFGASVAIDGTTMLIGAPSDDTGVMDAGAAYLFDTGGLQQTLNNPTPANGAGFGEAVALDGTSLLIGASNAGALTSGEVYLFDTGGTLLQTIANPTPDNTGGLEDVFGSAVAIEGSTIVVGDFLDRSLSPGASNGLGAVYVFNTSGTLLDTVFDPSPGVGDHFGIAVAIEGGNLLAGARNDDTGSANAGAVHLFSAASQLSLAQTFLSPTPTGNDQFGRSVALDGNNVLIGSIFDDIAGVDAGAAYLFDTVGTLQQVFLNPTPAADDEFGVSLALQGSNVLIGALFDDAGAMDSGAVYLFDTGGTLQQTFLNPTPAVDDRFGRSIGIDGTNVLIGAFNDDTGAMNSGAAYLFNTTGTLLQTYFNPTPAAIDEFGFAVAIQGTNVLIGANLDDAGAVDTGAAYLFNTTGTLLQTFTNPTPQIGDRFGFAVALDSTNLLIGAQRDDTAGTDAGAAYLFNTTGALQQTYLNPTPGVEDIFGFVLDLEGSNVLIGARLDDTAATDAGAAHLFDTSGNLLQTFNAPTSAMGDQFGRAVALGGSNVLIGAHLDDTGAADGGAAYLYTPGATPFLFNENPGDDFTFDADLITATTNLGTNIVLQANNDITINEAISTTNPSGDGGAITFQAGRSINVNANITTDNGNLTLSANDPGAGAANRDAGAGMISIDTEVEINTGTGTFLATLGTGDSAGIILSNMSSITTTTGNVTLDSNRTIRLNPESSISTTSGNITLNANTAGLSIGTFAGIELNDGDVISTSGNITLTGQGGNTGGSNRGIAQINGSQVQTTSGAITYTGQGGDGGGTLNTGIFLRGATIASTGTGPSIGSILLNGTSGFGTTSNTGILLSASSTIQAVEGAIDLIGIGRGSDANNAGIAATNSLIQSSGTGANAATITLTGIAGLGSATTDNEGVLLSSSMMVTSADGDITVSGQSDTTGATATDATGVSIETGAQILSTGTGTAAATITITGTGGSGNTLNRGVVTTATSQVSSIDGDITITGTGGAGTTADNHGIHLLGGTIASTGLGKLELVGSPLSVATGSGIQANNVNTSLDSGTGNLSLTGDTLTLTGATLQGTGDFAIAPFTSGTEFTPDFTNIPASFASLTVGSLTAGTVNLPGTATLNLPTTILGETIDLTGSLDSGANNLTLTASRNIALNPGSSITSTTGNLTLTANSAGTTTGNFSGIVLDGAQLTTTTGTINLTGQGGKAGTSNYGIQIRNDAQIETTAGLIQLDGTGGNANSTDNDGIQLTGTDTLITAQQGQISLKGTAGSGDASEGLLLSRGIIASTGTGATAATITLTGQGDTGSQTAGVQLGTDLWVSAVDGDITIDGTGGNATTTDLTFENSGIRVRNGAVIESLGTGVEAATITLQGTAGAGTEDNRGISLESDALITSIDGNIMLTGTGGQGSGKANDGIALIDGAQVESTGTGTNAATITLVGTGGTGTLDNVGVVLQDFGSMIRSIDGAIQLIGTGGNGSGDFNDGVSLIVDAQIESLGTGAEAATITLKGTGGIGAENNRGISLESDALITSIDGNIMLTGTGGQGSGNANDGVTLMGGAEVDSTGTGADAANIVVNGTSTASTGVHLTDQGKLESVDGDIIITGTGATAGIALGEETIVQSIPGGGGVGDGHITLQGTGTGTTGIGILMSGSSGSSFLRSTEGNVSATGQGAGTGSGIEIRGDDIKTLENLGNGTFTLIGLGDSAGAGVGIEGGSADGIGIHIFSPSLRFNPGSTGTLQLVANTLQIDANAGIQGAGTLIVQPIDPATAIGLGDGAAGTLNLDSTELANLLNGFTQTTIGQPAASHTISLGTGLNFNAPIFLVGGPTVNGPEQATTWTTTGINTGEISGLGATVNFTEVTTINAGNAIDTVNATSGDDVLTLRGTNAILLSGIDFSNIEIVDAGAGTDTITATAVDDQFSINGTNAIVLAGIDFGNIEIVDADGGVDILNSTIGNDDFVLVNNGFTVAGLNFANVETVNAGAGVDTITATAANEEFTVNGTNALLVADINFNDIEIVDAGEGVDTLNGTIGNDNFVLAVDASTVAELIFSNVEVVNGQAGDDRFSVQGGSLIDSLNGGAGIDTLVSDNTTTFSLTGVDQGTVTGLAGGFTTIENLTGSPGDDRFTLAGGTLSGTIDGGAGIDTLNGDSTDNAFTITGADQGAITDKVAAWSNIENLVGNVGNDSFSFSNDSRLSGNIVTGTGTDRFSVGANVSVFGDVSGSESLTFEGTDLDLRGFGDLSSASAFNLEATGDLIVNTITTTGQPIVFNSGGTITASNLTTTGSTTGTIEISAANAITIADITSGGSITTTASNAITLGTLTTPGQAITLTSNNGTLTTGNLVTSAATGGEVTLIAALATTTGLIDTSGTEGNGGTVFIDPIGDVEVELINAQGGTDGTGGTVDITAGQFFRATGSFVDQNGTTASISTTGRQGGGEITIRHGGGSFNTPFIIGMASANGTIAAITSGNSTIDINQTFFGSFSQDITNILTPDSGTFTDLNQVEFCQSACFPGEQIPVDPTFTEGDQTDTAILVVDPVDRGPTLLTLAELEAIGGDVSPFVPPADPPQPDSDIPAAETIGTGDDRADPDLSPPAIPPETPPDSTPSDSTPSTPPTTDPPVTQTPDFVASPLSDSTITTRPTNTDTGSETTGRTSPDADTETASRADSPVDSDTTTDNTTDSSADSDTTTDNTTDSSADSDTATDNTTDSSADSDTATDNTTDSSADSDTTPDNTTDSTDSTNADNNTTPDPGVVATAPGASTATEIAPSPPWLEPFMAIGTFFAAIVAATAALKVLTPAVIVQKLSALVTSLSQSTTATLGQGAASAAQTSLEQQFLQFNVQADSKLNMGQQSTKINAPGPIVSDIEISGKVNLDVDQASVKIKTPGSLIKG